MFGLIISMLLVLGKNLSTAGPLSVLPTHTPFFFFSWYAIYNIPKELGINAFLSHYVEAHELPLVNCFDVQNW